jgi:hypothetical protein
VPCTPITALGSELWYAARVAPNNYIDFQGWLKHTGLSSGSATWEIDFEFYEVDASWISTTTSTAVNLTSTYTQYGFSMFAPAAAYYLIITAYVHWYSPSPTSAEVYADDFELEVS